MDSRTLRVVMRHEGTEHSYEEADPYLIDGNLTEQLDALRWMWLEDDYGCDCNRGIFIERHCGVDVFPDLDEWPCGETIELVSLVLVRDGDEHRIWPDEAYVAREEVRARLGAIGLILA